jgi:ribosomal protein L29
MCQVQKIKAMDQINIKKEILELKLNLVNLRIEKKVHISAQHYEKVAELRDFERQMLSKLEEIKIQLVGAQEKFENIEENVEDFYQLSSNLNEILNFLIPNFKFEQVLEDFNAQLLIEYDDLFKKKRALMEQYKFQDASVIQTQIMEIGQFLLKCAN